VTPIPGRFSQALSQAARRKVSSVRNILEARSFDSEEQAQKKADWANWGDGKRPWKAKASGRPGLWVVTRKYRHYDSSPRDPMEDLYLAPVKKSEQVLSARSQAFPGSVIKEPVYHQTGVNFKRPSLKYSTQGIIWFTTSLENIEAGDIGAQGTGFIKKWWVDIKNPAGWDEYGSMGLQEIQRAGFDGVLLEDGEGIDGFVFSPNQVRNA